MDLLPILEVTKDLGNLPVLHMSTDMDTKMQEVFGTEGPAATYPPFLVAVPFDNALSKATLYPLSASKSFISGYPVRSAFLRPPSMSSFVESSHPWAVPEGAKLVLVMSGGNGQALPWPEKLAFGGLGHLSLHVVVVVGRATEEGRRLRALPSLSTVTDDWAGGTRIVKRGRNPRVTLEVAVDPANQDADAPFYVGADMLVQLMDRADAIVTKPGGGTAAELAYRGLPALFDASAGLLHWEDFTVEVFESLHRGFRFTSLKTLQNGLLKAFRGGRSTVLAADPSRPGQLLDSAANLRAAVRTLMREECLRCKVFRT